MITLYYYLSMFYLWLAHRRPISDKEWLRRMDKSVYWIEKIRKYVED